MGVASGKIMTLKTLDVDRKRRKWEKLLPGWTDAHSILLCRKKNKVDDTKTEKETLSELGTSHVIFH